jgi:hypothetical protein
MGGLEIKSKGVQQLATGVSPRGLNTFRCRTGAAVPARNRSVSSMAIQRGGSSHFAPWRAGPLRSVRSMPSSTAGGIYVKS